MHGSRWFLVLVLVLVLVLGGCAAAEDTSVTEQTESSAYVFPLSEEIMKDEPDYLVLANVDSKLSADYAPKDLVNVTVRKSKDETMKVRKAVNEALKLMFADAGDDGIKLYAHSCYRSYATQKSMYASRLARVGYDDKWVQQAGASDHQTGLGIDVIGASWLGKERLNEGFAATKEGVWLAENCVRYGFVIRYPKGMEEITGINYEPWHLRFVGLEAAAYLYENELTLEEFSIIRENYLADPTAYIADYSEQTKPITDIGDGFEELN